MPATKISKVKKKRHYSKDVKEKLKDGKPWFFHMKIDNDVALKIVEEKENTPNGGGEYLHIINDRLRKSYAEKKKK